MEKKRKRHRVFEINRKAFAIWWKAYPAIFISRIVNAGTDTLIKYVPIYFSAIILEEISGNRNKDRLLFLVLIALSVTAGLMLINSLAQKWVNVTNFCRHMERKKIMNYKMLSMDYVDMDSSDIREKLSQIEQNETWSGHGLSSVIWMFETLIRAILGILGGIALTWSLFLYQVPETAGKYTILNNPLCTVLLGAVLVVGTIVSPFITNKANSYWAKGSKEATFGNRIFSFYGFKTQNEERAMDMRLYRQEKICRYYMMSDNTFGIGGFFHRFARGSGGLLSALANIISKIFVAVVYLYVGIKAWAGAFGVGMVTQYVGAITSLSGSFSDLIRGYGMMQNNAAYLEHVIDFMETPNKMYQGSLTTEKRRDNKYEIEFRNVSFRYPGNTEYALRNVSLRFAIGKKVAIVGQNGCGKTTFIKLLCRLYDPEEGEILLNGINIRKYNYLDYMKIFSVVFQDFQLLALSLGQCISTSTEYDSEQVNKCLQEAGFGDRINTLEKGLESYLYKDYDSEGVTISGGEAQKLAIARALYKKDAAFLILDEPTASLDPVAEHDIYTKFSEMVEGRSAIYISHRLSSCRFCDDILVFDNGKILQQGSHEELLAKKDGKYYQLWNAQAQYYV